MPGKLHGQQSLEGYISWGCKVSDITEHLNSKYMPGQAPEHSNEQNLHTPCPPGVYIVAGERETKAVTILFYFITDLATAKGKGPGKYLSEGHEGKRKGWKEVSVQLAAQPTFFWESGSGAGLPEGAFTSARQHMSALPWLPGAAKVDPVTLQS